MFQKPNEKESRYIPQFDPNHFEETRPQKPNSYQPKVNQKPQQAYQNQTPARKERNIWATSLEYLEIFLDFMKVIILFGGLALANLMDVVMGGIAMSVLFGKNLEAFGVSSVWFGSAFSLTFAAAQIFFFAVIKNKWKQIRAHKVTADVWVAIGLGAFIWLIDTTLDVSPVFLMIGNSQFQEIPLLYNLVSAIAVIGTFLICGFAEVFTTTIRQVLETVSTKEEKTPPGRRLDVLKQAEAEFHNQNNRNR